MFRQILAACLFSAGMATMALADDLEDFALIEGVWRSQTQFVAEDGSWAAPVEAQATGQTVLGGAFYELDAIIPFPGAAFTMRMVFAYDRFNQAHRLIIFDDINGYADLYVGGAHDAGGVRMDNLTTGTGFPNTEGGKVFGQILLRATGTGFEILAEASVDDGETWTPYMRIAFEPRS